MSASPGYFDVFKIPILRGRDFTDRDVAGAPGVVLINQSMAKKFWPNEDPVGQQIIIGQGVGPEYEEPPRRIIGIVGNIHNQGLEPRTIPADDSSPGASSRWHDRALRPQGSGDMGWYARTPNRIQFIAAVSEQLRQASGGFPGRPVRSMDEVVVGSTARQSFNMLLLSIFGASALVLASIGIYGLMAYSVQQRTQEMGIRMALGADRTRIRNLVVWQGMQLADRGSDPWESAQPLALTRLIASFLFGVKSWDPVVFVTVPLFCRRWRCWQFGCPPPALPG